MLASENSIHNAESLRTREDPLVHQRIHWGFRDHQEWLIQSGFGKDDVYACLMDRQYRWQM